MDELSKRKVLRMVPYGLYVVTTRHGDRVRGFLASWVMQASFRPPLLAIGVRTDSRSGDVLRQGKVFVVNVLANDQRHIAETFLKGGDAKDGHFGTTPFHAGKTGAPVLEPVPAYIECEVVNELAYDGDHTLFIGRIVDVGLRKETTALTHRDTGWNYAG